MEKNLPNYAFVGGTKRGMKVLENLFLKKFLPSYAFILNEDSHEKLVYSNKIKNFCENNNIANFTTKKLKNEHYDLLNSLNLDFIIVCGWRTLISLHKLNSLKFGIVVAHDSLLPKYRGFSPINWGVINGEKDFGVTLFLINEGNVDSGPILIQKKIITSDDEYAIDIYEKIISLTIIAFLDFFHQYTNNKLKKVYQDESKATYTCARHPDDGHINFNEGSKEIFNLIRALADPYPGAFFYFNNEKYIIKRAQIGPKNNFNFSGRIPGRVISINDAGVEILCGKGTLLITSVFNNENKIINPNTIIKSIRSTLK